MLNISLFSVPNRVRPAISLIRFTQLRSLGQQKLYCFANFGFFRAIRGMRRILLLETFTSIFERTGGAAC